MEGEGNRFVSKVCGHLGYSQATNSAATWAASSELKSGVTWRAMVLPDMLYSGSKQVAKQHRARVHYDGIKFSLVVVEWRLGDELMSSKLGTPHLWKVANAYTRRYIQQGKMCECKGGMII